MSKESLTDDLNKILGLMISLRTVETSALDTRHWVNDFIDKISNLRNSLVDGQFNNNSALGFDTKEIKEQMQRLLAQVENNKNKSLIEVVSSVISKY